MKEEVDFVEIKICVAGVKMINCFILLILVVPLRGVLPCFYKFKLHCTSFRELSPDISG